MIKSWYDAKDLVLVPQVNWTKQVGGFRVRSGSNRRVPRQVAEALQMHFVELPETVPAMTPESAKVEEETTDTPDTGATDEDKKPEVVETPESKAKAAEADPPKREAEIGGEGSPADEDTRITTPPGSEAEEGEEEGEEEDEEPHLDDLPVGFSALSVLKSEVGITTFQGLQAFVSASTLESIHGIGPAVAAAIQLELTTWLNKQEAESKG